MNNYNHILILAVSEPHRAAHGKLVLYDTLNRHLATDRRGDARTYSTRPGARGARSRLVNDKMALYTG